MPAVEDAAIQPVPASVISQCIQRLFQGNGFSQPVPLGQGIGYPMRRTGSFARTANFAMVFFPASSLLTAQMFFSIDNAPFSSKNKNKLCEISKYVESWNEQIAFGELKVEQERGVVYLQRELEVTEEAALEEDLVTLVNEMLTVFFSHVPCLYTLATATTSVDENSPSLQPVQIPPLQYFTYPRAQSNTNIARQN